MATRKLTPEENARVDAAYNRCLNEYEAVRVSRKPTVSEINAAWNRYKATYEAMGVIVTLAGYRVKVEDQA